MSLAWAAACFLLASATASQSDRRWWCSTCQWRQEEASWENREQYRLEAIKRQILGKLGLVTRPNVTRPNALSRELIIDTVTRSTRSEGRAKPTTAPQASVQLVDYSSEIITFAEPGSQVNGQTILEFPLGQSHVEGAELRVKSATLWLSVNYRKPPLPPDYNITFWVFRVLLNLPDAAVLNSKEFESYTTMSAWKVMSSKGWQKVDMTSTVSSWYGEKRTDKLRLLVDCSGCGRIWASLSVAESRPFLVVRSDTLVPHRVRRRALDCSGATGGQCCKQRFYVSFKQLGWDDWVVAPSGYYANYCRGDCAGARSLDTFVSYHSQTVEEYRRFERLAGLEPCCAPLRFSSATLIYYGPDMNIVKRDLPKMVVEECGCP